MSQATAAAPEPPAVRMRGIVKRFAAVTALDGVDFDLRRGEIHALLGENGAGKSTLMHLLAGLAAPDNGTIEVDGAPRRFRSAREATAAGIGMVHQHFALVDNLTVAENLALALPKQTPFLLPKRDLAAYALTVAERLGWKLDPTAAVRQLPIGVQQRLEIVKVLAADPRILIFDEPTAVLAPVEMEELFGVLGQLRADGKALIFISHKLPEVLRLADRITVLRRGRNAGTLLRAETDAAALAARMMGEANAPAGVESQHSPARALTPDQPLPEVRTSSNAHECLTGTPLDLNKDAVLALRALKVRNERGFEAVAGIDLDVRAGEIVGIAGVDGNGQTELVEAVAGLRPVSGGSARIDGRLVSEATRPEVGLIPQDRRRFGIVPGMSVRENLVLELVLTPEAQRGPWLRWDRLNRLAGEMRRDYDVRAGSLEQPAETLSGGNQQKILVARALRKEPRLIVALNPTRGLDVNATAYVHEQLRRRRETGAAILLISTELEEVTALSNRVGVLYEGRLMGVVPPGTSREALGLMMGGHSAAPADPA
jgi:simple sugar transport system ATP-binding protein